MSPSRDESTANSTILKHGYWTTIEDGRTAETEAGGERRRAAERVWFGDIMVRLQILEGRGICCEVRKSGSLNRRVWVG